MSVWQELLHEIDTEVNSYTNKYKKYSKAFILWRNVYRILLILGGLVPIVQNYLNTFEGVPSYLRAELGILILAMAAAVFYWFRSSGLLEAGVRVEVTKHKLKELKRRLVFYIENNDQSPSYQDKKEAFDKFSRDLELIRINETKQFGNDFLEHMMRKAPAFSDNSKDKQSKG
jgi:hypothetical protein